MATLLARQPMLAHALEQLTFLAALQRGRLVQGDQQGTQFEAAKILRLALGLLLECQAGLRFAEIDQWAFGFVFLVPGQQPGQCRERGERTKQRQAFTFVQVEGVALRQQQHLLVEAAQGAGRLGLEGRRDRFVQALLVLADPVQQVAVAPQGRGRFLIQLVVAQQLLCEKVLGHVQAPGQVRQGWLTALQDLQQQALETGRQLAAQAYKQRAGRWLAIRQAGVVAILVTEALQRTLPFQ